MLQFDEVRQQAMDGDRLADRQVGAPALGRRQHDMRAGREGEAAQRALDQGGGVLRHDAEVIAGAVADAIGQQHLDMPRAAARGVGLLQFAVGQHAHGQRAGAADDGIDRRLVDRLHLVERLLRGAGIGLERHAELVGKRRQQRDRSRPGSGRRGPPWRRPRRGHRSARPPWRPEARRSGAGSPGRSRPSRGCRSRTRCSARPTTIPERRRAGS